MAGDPATQLIIGLHRFGFGPRGDSTPAAAADAREVFVAELDRSPLLANPNLLSSGAAARAVAEAREKRPARPVAPTDNGASRSDTMQSGVTPGEPAMEAKAAQRKASGSKRQELFLQEAQARLDAALTADVGFRERLAWFWSNHFCVSAAKGLVRAICGPLEREAIRPHVFGRFRDMLLAVETHPAMLIYLDNARSVGPNSPAGRNRARGLNEKSCREILELHTLGVRTVYTQADVTNLANVITGWGMVPVRQDPQHGGEFYFNPRLHEPGAQVVLGKTYADTGADQGKAVLADIARHPATARHIATKLATHFVADKPPETLVRALEKRFIETDGDLKEVAKTLVTAPESWAAPRTKLKRPSDWIMGSLRAVGVRSADLKMMIPALGTLGEPLWRPSSPKGFSDDSATWMEGIDQRVDVASRLSRGLSVEPAAVADRVLGGLSSNDTRLAIARAADRPQAIALLLMAPEFQRR